jgi:hypothetical protein
MPSVSVASIALPLADANLAFFISHLRLSKMLEKMLLCVISSKPRCFCDLCHKPTLLTIVYTADMTELCVLVPVFAAPML